MIRICFEGGLGNQMFQYAYGRYLQKKYNEDIVGIDVSDYTFEKKEIRDFDLSNFNISENWKMLPVESSKVKRFGLKYIPYFLVTILYTRINAKRNTKKQPLLFTNLYENIINRLGFFQDHFGLKKEPIKYSKNLIVRGNWFNTGIIRDIFPTIKNELKVKTELSESNRRFLDQITQTNSVAVHIRRGDYVKLGLVVCDINYYCKSIRHMKTLVEKPVFFIFSDDIPWVKQELHVDADVVFIDNNNPSYEDMRLMYSCNHFIMSNSTFSWWAAFSGEFRDKVVLTPAYWSKARKRSSFILDEWIQIDNFS